MTPEERPILFSAPMVRAILDGRKTQTRRLVKPQWPPGVTDIQERPALDPFLKCVVSGHSAEWEDGHSLDEVRRCPYGAPGDRLWVKEAWTTAGCRKHGEIEDVQYRADEDDDAVTWFPSIHMPRWASRITLEITGVRVERLQDMEGQAPYPGESDALAEGINRIQHGDGDYGYSAFRDEPHPKNWTHPVSAYRELWESINGPGSWAANPWVWVVSFRRVKP